MPFASVDEVIREAIAYNVARPNEKFLGYVDGQYRAQSRPQVDGRATLAGDADFSDRVASITDPARGTYRHPQLGEIVYAAVPVTLTGDPARGVIVAAYLADAERRDADEAARLMLIVGAVTLLGAVGAAWLVAGRILRPLRDITETARTITETDLSQRIPRRGGDGDELGDLVATVNGMLDRVETGVAAQRRFVDDAGHELRTPITIIRGHLEVLDPTDPADVTSTVALVDNELERMNRMVSDLLLLAQSEQPAFLRPEPVDVAALTTDTFDKVACARRSRFRRGGGGRRARRPGPAAHHPGVGCPRRQRLSLHRSRRPDRDRVARRTRVAAVLDHRLGPRRQRRGPLQDLRALRPGRRGSTGNPTVPVWAWRSSAPSPSRTAATSYSTAHQDAAATFSVVLPSRPRRRGAMTHILIAEDEQRIASFIEKGLSANGFAVTTVADGPSAYDYAATGDFDLMVLDIGLPELDGFEVLPGCDPRATHSGHRVHRAQQRARHGRRAGGRGRRLHGQAVSIRGAVGPCPAATDADAHRGRIAVLSCGGLQLDLRTRRAQVGGRRSTSRLASSPSQRHSCAMPARCCHVSSC